MSREDPAVADATTAPPPVPGLGWRTALIAFGGFVALLTVLFWNTLVFTTQTWNQSATYNHCWLILPIIGWLIWQRKPELLQLSPKPFLPGLVIVVGAALVMLVGEVADANVIRQVALVGMIQGAVVTIFGLQVTRALLFPLFYMVFLIPVGDELVPSLQKITAAFSVWMLHLMDIPVFQDGIFISIPNGEFEVAEACAGVRFLIATLALGALYANIAFRSWPKRLAVMVLFATVPIFANGIRAWGIIMIAHLSNNEYAVGVDHIVYGWGFFVFITLILLLICRTFSDKTIDDPQIDIQPILAWQPVLSPVLPKAFMVAAGVCGAAALAGHGYAQMIERRAPDFTLAAAKAPQIPGWTPIPFNSPDWEPVYKGADAVLKQSYRDAQGREVTLYVAGYAKQREDAEMVAFGNGAYAGEGPWVWSMNLDPNVKLRGALTPAQAFRIKNDGMQARDVWQWYSVNGVVLASPARAKLEQVKAKLLGGPTLAATVMISAERVSEQSSPQAAMQAFADAAGPVDGIITQVLGKGGA
jgi:exosortase A